MGFKLENHTLLYIIIAFFVVQLLVMRYYVQSSIEDSNHKNNKKIVKKLTGQISTTFDQYMGGNRLPNRVQDVMEREDGMGQRRPDRREDVDSIEDPAENVEEDDVQEESEE